MKYANIYGAFLRSVAGSASDAAVGAWTRLLAFVAELETQDAQDPTCGRLAGAATWNDRALITASGTDRAGVAEAVAAGLVVVDGDDLVVRGYDADAHAKVAALRENGKYGKLGGRPPKPSRVTKENPPGFSSETQAEPSGSETETPSLNSLTSPNLSSLPTSGARTDTGAGAHGHARVCDAPSAAQVQTRFKRLYQERHGALPYMGGGEAVRTFHERLVGTAQHRGVDPLALLEETFARWKPKADDELARSAPYAAFAGRFGALLETQAGYGDGMTERQRLDAQAADALKAGDMGRYQSLVAEIRRRFGGGDGSAG